MKLTCMMNVYLYPEFHKNHPLLTSMQEEEIRERAKCFIQDKILQVRQEVESTQHRKPFDSQDLSIFPSSPQENPDSAEEKSVQNNSSRCTFL